MAIPESIPCFARVLLAASACLVALHSTRAADRLPQPPGAVVVVAADDVAAACQAFAASPTGATLCGPAFTPLIEELARREQASPLYPNPAFGFGWRHLAATDRAGQLLVLELPDNSLGVAALFEVKPGAAEPDCLAAAREYYAAHGYRESTMARTDAKVSLFERTTEGKHDTRVLFYAPGYAGVADSLAAVDAVLPTAPPADRPPASPDTRQDGAGASLHVHIRPWPFLDLLTEGPSTADAQRSESDASAALATAHRVGWDGITAITGTVDFAAAEPWQWHAKLSLQAERPLRQALQMWSFLPGPAPPLPRELSDDASGFLALRWDFPEAMKGFAVLFDDANEPGPDGEGLFDDLLYGLLEDPEGPRVDLRRDLFGQLGPEVVQVARPAEDGDSEVALYRAAVRDRAKVLDVLTRFYEGDDRVTHAQRGPFEVWAVPPGNSLFVEGESDSVIMIRALALGEDSIFFSTDAEMLLTAIDEMGDDPGSPSKLWQERYDALLEGAPTEAAVWGFADLARAVADDYEAAITPPGKSKSNAVPIRTRAWRLLLFGERSTRTTPRRTASAVRALYEKGPRFNQIRPALAPLGIVLTPSDAGWEATFNVLRPE